MTDLRTIRIMAAAGAVAMVAVMPAGPAAAGRSCTVHTVSVAEITSAIDVAERVRDTLNGQARRYALVARVGNDVSEHGLKYTHVGIARKRASDGAWMVVQQLNPCAANYSTLHVHGLVNFMLDDLFLHDVLVVTLDPNLEAGMDRVFERGDPRRIYDPEYSMISYPGTPPRYQNSNQWILEIIAQAQAERAGQKVADRWGTHRFYRQNGYQGSTIQVSALKRALAGLASANVRFDDHPRSSQARGTYEVVSVRSVVDYLRRTGDARQVIEIHGSYRRPASPPAAAVRTSADDDPTAH